MVPALAAVKSSTERATMQRSWPSAKAAQYGFDYDDETISELERTIAKASGVEPLWRFLMEAMMAANTSCRASRDDLRGGLRGFDKFGGTLCVGCGGPSPREKVPLENHALFFAVPIGVIQEIGR
jgi:hypothetical protein